MTRPGRGRGISGSRRLNPKRLALAAVITAAAGLLVFIGIRQVFAPGGPAPAAKPQPAPAASVPPPPPPLAVEKIVIPKGANLARLLRPSDFDGKAIHALKDAVTPVYDLAKIKAGHEMRLGRETSGAWRTLEYDIDEMCYLVVRNEAGGVKAELKYYPFEVKPALVYGTIETSLIAAMNRIDEESNLALDLVERCFGWDVDFYADVRKGDAFRILVEKKFLDGKFSGYRNILVAEFTNEGKVFRAFRYTYPDSGVTDYFDENGLSKRKEFLKSPFKFTPRITSRFSSSRLHPIYKVYRPHYGVDYGAAEGTPVQATADGRVTEAGWNGGSGRMVRLQHKNGYETAYLHLSGFGPGIRVGAEVRGGSVVGYVGSSGDSTGPHLDYRIYYHGSPVNPLSQKFKPADPLRKEFLEPYRGNVLALGKTLEAPAVLSKSAFFFGF